MELFLTLPFLIGLLVTMAGLDPTDREFYKKDGDQ
jgi:hypothetical protein